MLNIKQFQITKLFEPGGGERRGQKFELESINGDDGDAKYPRNVQPNLLIDDLSKPIKQIELQRERSPKQLVSLISVDELTKTTLDN